MKTNNIKTPLTVLFKENSWRQNCLYQKYINEYPTDTENIKKIMKIYQEMLSSKFYNLEELEILLKEKNSLVKLSKEKT